MISEYLKRLQAGENLSSSEAAQVMRLMLEPETSDAQIAALLTALAFKGETVDEIVGFASVMRERAVKIRTHQESLIDTAGTGGGINTFNISTTAAFVISAAGVPVAKHGNVAMTSRCGSADLLRELGVKVDARPEIVERCLNEIGIAFLFAPCFHPAMKRVAAVRRQLGIKTAFNLLGPLTNPARARMQVVGVYSLSLTEPIALALKSLGASRAMVLHSADGMDEVSPFDATEVVQLKGGAIDKFVLNPRDLGLRSSAREEIAGGNASHNARITLGVLSGRERGSARDAVLLNAAAGLVVGGAASDFKAGIEMAAEAIDSGEALRKLEQLVSLTNI